MFLGLETSPILALVVRYPMFLVLSQRNSHLVIVWIGDDVLDVSSGNILDGIPFFSGIRRSEYGAFHRVEHNDGFRVVEVE